MTRPLSARVHRSGMVLSAAVTLLAAAAWAAHHAVQAANYGSHTGSRLAAVWGVTFLLLLAQTLMYHAERVRRPSPRARRQLDALHAAILMPVFNEDPGYLCLGLESLLAQTRRPDSVHVVDDGSGERDEDGNITRVIDYADVRDWWMQAAAEAGIATTWERQPNAGKRHAQAAAVRASAGADLYVTVDSDSCLAPNAVEEILLPFAKQKIQSVAGIVLATNHRANLLTRLTDLWFTTGQLTDRSALSAMGSVLVNSGPLAAYRAAVIRDNLDSYLNETFMGRPVMFSDDSLLTLYALLRGKTVQQPSAIVFTALPERVSHWSRMYLRWMRGSTIRSLWRLRYLPVTGYAYWAHLIRWFTVALSTTVLGWLLIVEPVKYGDRPPASFLLVPVLIGWAQALRYLGVIRSDERIRSRAVTWLLMPVAVLASWTVLRAMRWYGMATCARTGWGTRQNGAEVAYDQPAPAVDFVDQDTVQLPRIPLKKLYDPDTETTLTIALPGR